jgi:putative ABC transport system permease protein
LTSAFLIAQFALSIVLLAQVVVSFQVQGPQVESDRAIDTPSLLAASIMLPPEKYPTPITRLSFYERIGALLESTPGIAAVTVASHLPFGGGREQRLEINGRPSADTEPTPTVQTVTIGPGYFATLGVSMQQGREFAAQDGQPGAAHAIVNARFAQMFFADGDAIGRLIRVSSSDAPAGDAPWLSVIGVASDVRQRNLPTIDPVMYVPLAAAPLSSSSLIVRTTMEPAAAARRVRDEAARIDPLLPLYRVMTMSQALENARWNGRASHNLILTITTVALILSLIGLYAVTALVVAQRSQEIGIRIALGARPGQVRRLILSGAFTHVAAGAVAGLMGAMAWDAAFVSGRAGFFLVSPEVLGPVVLLLMALTVTACLVPIRRATRLDPVATLRQD